MTTKEKILSFIIIGLFIIILFQRCGNSPTIKQGETKTKIEYITKDSIIKSPGTIKYTKIPYIVKVTDTQYIPSNNYDTLRNQYKSILDSFTEKRAYTDVVKYDSLNFISINDTLQFNKIINRSIGFHLKEKITTITRVDTLVKPIKTKVFFGIGLLGNQKEFIKGIEINLSLETSKSKFFELKSQYINNEIIYGVGTKWKL